MSITSVTRGGHRLWVVRWREDGRRMQRTLDSKADAETIEAQARRRRQMGALAVAAPSSERLGALLVEWVKAEGPAWSLSTLRTRGGILGKWIEPYLENVRLRDLGTMRVREWRSAIQRDGASPTQANSALSIFSSFCGWLVRDGRIERNPCSGVRKLPVRMKRPRALLPVEVEQIRNQMESPRDRLAVSLMAYAGLRPGEAFGLDWDSVSEHVLVIDRAFTDGELKDTKTHSRRSVEILPPLAEDIEPLRQTSGPVLANRYGEHLLSRNWQRRVWRPAVDALGMQATPYDLRHTYASLLIHEGAPLPLVAAQLGHSSLTTTLKHYAHALDQARHAPRRSMVEAIEEARSQLAPR